MASLDNRPNDANANTIDIPYDMGTPNTENHNAQQRETPLIPQKEVRPSFVRRITFPLMLIIVGLAIAGVILYFTGCFGSNGSSSFGGQAIMNLPSSCEAISPSKRVAAFWQTETDGCTSIPEGVTHVIWGFSIVNDNQASLEFQGNKDTLKKCIQTLRKRCIVSFASVGGANNMDGFAQLTDPKALTKSIVNLVKEYDFDGVDMDDETVGKEFNKERTIEYMKSISGALKDMSTSKKHYQLTFDAYFYEGSTTYCQEASRKEYTRCFPTEILPYVDFIHIMAYNVAKEATEADDVYAGAKDIFDQWISLVKSAEKLMIGICTGNGCAYGKGPDNDVIIQWTKYQSEKGAGGMMIYAASDDKSNGYEVTKAIIKNL